MWAVLVPSALSYAVIVGVEPIVGLYTVPLALLGYAIFGGSKLLVVGPDAAISVLAASTVAGAATGQDEYLDLVIALSLLVGVLHLVFYVLRMGWVADLVPDPVLKGFVQGLVWVTILDQVPKLLGLELVDPPSGFWGKSVDVAAALGDAHTETAVLGIASLVSLFVMQRLLAALPGPLVVLVATMIVVKFLGLGDDGVALVGEPAGGLFGFGFPRGVDAEQYASLIPGALAIVVLGFTESMGASKAAAQKTGERQEPNQELLALGSANIGASLSGGYVVTGALSKTSVAIASGGRTQAGNLFAGVLGILTILVLRPLFDLLASTVLAAVVIYAMSGMASTAYFKLLWKLDRREFLIGMVAFTGVLTLGVLKGVIVAVVLSLVMLVLHIGNPPSSILGRSPSGHWYDTTQRDDVVPIPGVLVWRQEAPLVFLNARRLSDRLRDLITEDTHVLVVDSSVVSGVDTTGFTAFVDLQEELSARGIELRVVHPLARTWAKAERQAAATGKTLPPMFASVDDAVADRDAVT